MTRGRIIALAVAAVAVLAGTLAQLTHKAPRQTGSNDATAQGFSVSAPARKGVCQDNETLYRATRELLMTIAAFGKPTPPLEVEILQGERTVARGGLPAGWGEGALRIPVAPAPRKSLAPVTVCVRSPKAPRDVQFAFGGEPTPPEQGARIGSRGQPGRFSLETYYGRPRSLLDVAPAIAHHYDSGNARWLGGWTLIVVIGLVVAALVAAGIALNASTSGRVPRAARAAVAVALLVGSAWALLTPPFMVPDETSHVAYVQGMVETGKLPLARGGTAFSGRENDLLAGLHFYDVIGAPSAKPPWTDAEAAAVQQVNASQSSRKSFNASSASSNPPLYYLVQAPVYALTRGLTMLDQLLPLRLVSVLFGGLTVLFTFLFLTELLPGRPETWAPGALVVALQPLFGFITGGVNADAGLFACGAATLWLICLVLRRGLTWRRGLGLGAALAAGLLTKPLFLGLFPAGVLALAIAAWRRAGSPRMRLGMLAGALALAVLPVILYDVLGNLISGHPYFPDGVAVTGTAAAAAGGGTPTGLAALRIEAFYIWQLFLPRLPFMADRFAGPLPLRVTWFDGFIGRFGWLDYAFSQRVTDLAVKIAFAVLALVVVGLVRARSLLRRRWAEALCLAIALAGILGAIGVQQYNAANTGAPSLTQTRYLLPLLALYGGLASIAMGALGRRVAPYLGVALVAAAALHEIGGMLLTVMRYYT